VVAEPEQAEEEFGPYRVYERLGVGGMATVHRALERGIEGFERMVALKRLLPHLAEDASFIKAFVREAKLASLLNHVNIVQIFELGRVGTEYFISMEYIDGRDIRRILRHARKVTGPPPINITVGILIQLCDALDYAHNKGDEEGQPLKLVHRDVSPSNVLVTSAGHVKVIDFGIAKAQSSQLRTQTGRVKGKLAYMAPEAITGKELDARSDLFAVGVIAHELLTARPLFASKNEYQTLLKVQRGDIMPPSTFNQACPPELDAIVLGALARDPDQRFTHATELRDELLAMKRQYNLQTGYRDIAAWVEWAFSLEVPSSGFSGQHTLDNTGQSQVVDAPAPRKQDEEEAVEIAWGGGNEQEEDAGPVVLDDVPDVSEKHRAYAQGSDDIIVDLDELDDDIPPAAPSHGARPTELPSQKGPGLSFPPVLEGPLPGGSGSNPLRSRRGTEPGHTPAPSSNRPSGQMAVESVPEETIQDMPAVGREDLPPGPKQPTIRFKAPTIQPSVQTSPPITEAVVIPLGQPVKPVATKPGYSPAKAATVVSTDDPPPITTQRLRPKTSSVAPPVAAAIVRPEKKDPRTWWVLAAMIVAGGVAATAITLYVTRGQDTVETVSEEPSPRVAPRTVGTVKFNTEPSDAQITIDGKLAHSGSPWVTELEAGVHQLQIEAKDHKAWLTSLELSAAETQTLRVVLEPLGTASVMAEATLILRTTPSGLDAILDGKPLQAKTPIKMPLSVGAHTVVVMQDGVEMWRQDLVAKASANYEFSPVVDAEHQRERAEVRKQQRPAAVRPSEPEVSQTPKDAAAPPPAPVEQPKVEPALPPAPKVTPAVPPPANPTVAQPVPAPQQPAVPRGPVTVPPSAVTKVSGNPPQIGKTKNADMPAVVAAKVCIDATGKVTGADMITKIERRSAEDLVDAIKTWQYAPYKQSGVPTPACFAISFRVK